MTLPSSGPISFSQINTELGKASNATISLNDGDVRNLAGKASGAISMSDLLGKSSGPVFDYPPGYYERSARGTVIFKITSTVPCVWTYTRSGTGSNVPTTTGQTSNTFQMQATAPNPNTNRTCQWNLTATYNGVDYNWTCQLVALGTGIS